MISLAATTAAAMLAAFSPFQAEEEHVRAGNERLRAGDPAGAARSYDEAERAVGSRAEIDFDRGNAAFREGRMDDAKAAWGRAARVAPAPLASRALQNLGNALFAEGDRDGAARAFADALTKDPTNEDARWNLEVLQRKTSPPPPASGRKDQDRGGSKSDRSDAKQRQEERDGGGRETQAQRDRDRAQPRQEEGRDRSPNPAEPREREDEGGGAERRADEPRGPSTEPLSRQEAEALLDALRAREKRMPPLGRERAKARRADAAKDW